MIIELLLDCIYSIFNLLTSVINIPQLPPDINTYLSLLFDYLTTGFEVVACYTYGGYLMTLLGIVIAVDVGIKIYQFVMWVIKKIPMASIS